MPDKLRPEIYPNSSISVESVGIEQNQGRWTKLYQEAREKITTPDDELIRLALSQGQDFPDKSFYYAFNRIFDLKKAYSSRVTQVFLDKLRNRTANKPMLDIGCGKEGADHAGYLQSKDYFNAIEVVLVDPFVDQQQINKDIAKEHLNPEKVKIVVKDGLTYLKTQKDNSGNVIVNSLDSSVVPVPDYLRRLAQEMFRVTPEDGVAIVSATDYIGDELQSLFPYRIKWGEVMIFYKLPFPKAQELLEEHYRRRGYTDEQIKEYVVSTNHPLDDRVLTDPDAMMDEDMYKMAEDIDRMKKL